MEKQVIHIFRDPKFFKLGYNSYALSAPKDVENLYFCAFSLPASENSSYKNVFTFSSEKELTTLFRKHASRNIPVCVHCLSRKNLRIFERFRNSYNFYIFLWGAEVYALFPSLKQTLYLPLTRRLLTQNRTQPILSVKELMRLFYLTILYPPSTPLLRLRYRRCLNTAKGVIAPVPEAFEKYRKMLKFDNISLRHAYQISEKTPTIHGNTRLRGNLIIGNSASPYNNHIDIFNLLKTIDLNFLENIVCPLSYSDKPPYKNNVIQIAKELFGNRFLPITNLMPYNEYAQILANCSYAIFGSKRQHAGGNIRLLLSLGVTVFLYRDNIFYEHFKNLGVVIRDIEELNLDGAISSLNLSNEERNNNIERLNHDYSLEVLISRNRQFFNDLF